jgi:hypothetical protein
MKSWKTTLVAILTALTGAAVALHYISSDTAAAIATILVSLGFVAAKDNNVTGGTKQQ